MQDDDDRWGSVSDAAQVFGVSVDTIRRRMKRGELTTRREQTPQGFRWLIQLPGQAAPQDAPGSPRTNDRGEQGATVVPGRDVLLETLQRELELRNREITRLHEVVAYQAQAIERVTAAIPATTRQDAPERAEGATHDGGHVQDAPRPSGKRWGFWEWLRGR